MRISRYIPKLALDNVKKKKSRTFLSFISVMLSSSIIFVSLVLFTTVFTLSKSLNTEQIGSAHYHVISDHFEIVDPFRFQVSTLSLNENSPFAYYTFDENASFFYLDSGRLPENEKEILVSFDQQAKIGDTINGYLVCGIYQPTHFLLETSDKLPILSIDPAFQTDESHYFIHDVRVQDETSLKMVSEYAGRNISSFTLNDTRISNDTITNYLQDTTTILGMFIVIVVIAGIMCLVSIYNVLIVNDQDRRKEIGLLKSIGITRKELKVMIIIELGIIGVIGGIVGILVGSGISFIVLSSVMEKLKATLTLNMIFIPWIIIVALGCSVLLMVGSGYLLYHKYFYSKPISDLKGEPVEYDIPYNPERFSIDSVPWRMFVIYNERIKKQTRNLRRSFFLVMLTITLFCGIWFSNFFYQKNYMEANADFCLEQANFLLGNKTDYPLLDDKLYAIEKQTGIELSSLLIDRSVLGIKFYAPMDSFTNNYGKGEQGESNSKVIDNVTYSSVYHDGVVLDQKQLEELSDYVVCGSLDNLNENSVILISNQYGSYVSKDPTRVYETGYQILCETISKTEPYPNQYLTVDCIIELPFKKMNLKYSEVDDVLYTVAMTPESFKTLGGSTLTLKYSAKMKLDNLANHSLMVSYLQEGLNDLSLSKELKMTDYIQMKNDGEFGVFMIEVLLYPLLFMLVIIGVVNINNVLKGNIHMKRTDFSTMKSVGMTHYQLRMTMLYEYAENYINAGVMTFLLCIPVYILENFFSIASTFKIGDNFAGMFIMSFAILSPALIFSLAAISFRHLKDISALDGMKDVT